MTPRFHRALLIDDEPLARLELRRLLARHPEVEIVGEAGTMEEGAALLREPGYTLVFLDVQLRGGSGFDLLPEVRAGVGVVFVTAFDQYAVRAFEVNAIDYLLKPVTPARLEVALRRGVISTSVPASGGVALTAQDQIYLQTGISLHILPVAAIGAICAYDGQTDVLLVGGERLRVLRSLANFEETLPPAMFRRVGRQTLVNVRHVTRITRLAGNEVLIELVGSLPLLPATVEQVANWPKSEDPLASPLTA